MQHRGFIRQLALFAVASFVLATGCGGSAPTETPTPSQSAASPALATPLPASSASPVDKNVIRIGYIIPLSGQSAEPGQRIVDGMNLYLDQIHHRMAGKRVEVILENDESDPAVAMAKLHKLVSQDRVQVLSGMFLSSCLYQIAPLVEQCQIPFVVVSAGADDVTQRKRKKWIVRTCYTGSQPSHPFGEYVAKKLGYKRVVTIASDYAYGYEVVGGFQQTFEENGGKVVQKLWAPLGFKDFAAMIKQIQPDADAVFFCIVGQSAEIIARQYKEFGPKLPIIGLTASFDESFYPRMGDELLGAVSASLYSTALDTPANKRFVAAYRSRYSADPSYFSEHGYTAMMFLHKAIESLDGDLSNSEKLLAALRKVELKDAPRGPVKIDEYGSSIDNIYVRKTERVNGKLQNTVVYIYPNVSQFWTYNPQAYLKQPPYTKTYPP